MMTDLLHYCRKTFNHWINRGKREEGFSVLEAMIAIAILSAALLPIYALQSQFIRSVESFERSEIRIEARENALTYIKTRNFHVSEAGEIDLGATQLQWQATPAGPPQMSRGGRGTEGRYEMTLYNVAVTLTFANGTTDQFAVRGLGWRPVRPFIPNGE